MAVVIASSTAHTPQNSTILIQPSSHNLESKIGVPLRIHLILMIASSIFLFPLIIILRRRKHSWFIASEVVTVITMVLGIATTYPQHRFYSASHSALGYFIVLLLTAGLCTDIWRNKYHTLSKFSLKALKIFHRITIIALPLLLYTEIVLGVIALSGFCSSPYTQQCFGHLGLGSLYLLYFSFWAVLVHDNGTFSNLGLRSEALDAILLVPCGVGLSLFGHAWGYPWDDEALQHVCLGLFTIIAVLVGTWLSKDFNGRPRRNILPGLVSFVVGYTFLSHPAKPNHLLSALHQVLGVLSTGIGICRILDVVFVTYLTPHPRTSYDGSRNRQPGFGLKGPWNALASFLGITVGIVVMVANEEQAEVLERLGLQVPSVFMVLLAMGMGVMGYVILITVLANDGRRCEMGGGYEEVDMGEDV